MHRVFLKFFRRNLIGLLLFAVLLPLGGTLSAQPKNGPAEGEKKRTLKDYREDIQSVSDDLSSMYSPTREDFEDWSRAEQIAFEKDFYDNISNRLPPQENIEWEGTETGVDNRWLHTRLADLKKLSLESKERDPIVTELRDRLAAIEAKLDEQLASTAGSRSKDEEKQKLAQILQRPEYQAPEKKEKGALERWWEAFTNWLSSLFPKSEPMQPVEARAGSGIPPEVVQILIVGLAIAVIAFVIWRFAPAFRYRRKLKKEGKDAGERIILGEKLAADESSASLFEQAESMAREGNFRGAIRKGYIALLCELGDRKIIRLAQHKTNRDYLRDVRKNKDLHRGVGELTSLFESHWYGLSSASEEDWGAFRESYRQSSGKL